MPRPIPSCGVCGARNVIVGEIHGRAVLDCPECCHIAGTDRVKRRREIGEEECALLFDKVGPWASLYLCHSTVRWDHKAELMPGIAVQATAAIYPAMSTYRDAEHPRLDLDDNWQINLRMGPPRQIMQSVEGSRWVEVQVMLDGVPICLDDEHSSLAPARADGGWQLVKRVRQWPPLDDEIRIWVPKQDTEPT